MRCSGVPIGAVAFQYGVDTALQAFPFSSLITTATSQINNANVSVNLQDILPQFLQMNDKEDQAYYNGMTPSLPDGAYANYIDALNANNNPLNAFQGNTYDDKLQGRGSFPVSITVEHTIYAGGTDTSLVSTNTNDTWIITLSTIVTEPLWLSPFTWGNPEHNAQGLCGVNNMTLNLNIDTTLKRLVSTCSPYVDLTYGGAGCLAGSATNPNLFQQVPVGNVATANAPSLLFKFLSTQSNDLIETKNVVPYTDYPRYLTPALSTGSIFGGGRATFTTQNIQLNQIPSKIMVCARIPMSSQNISNSATFLCIQAISVNLNNASGLLSTSSTPDLWRISSRNHSNQTWLQFSGQATKASNNYVGIPGASLIGTGGSLLVLNPAYDLSLPTGLSNGSMGNFNLQFQITVYNQFSSAVQPEIVVVCANDGILVTQQGVSATYTGILTQQMVLDANKMSAKTSSEEHREVGGRMHNMTRFRHPRMHRMMGMGHSGGAHSGGAVSGGKHSKLSGLMK
jgi:hypothetical protein